MSKRIGIDIDGVLADFQPAYIKRTIEVLGKDLFPPRPFKIPCWTYPEYYGYTSEEVKTVWASIMKDRFFWWSLDPYPETKHILDVLYGRILAEDDIYFITDRPGIIVKDQTETWLKTKRSNGSISSGEFNPTVLISGQKGLCCRALKLDAYLDDKWENCIDVRSFAPTTKTYMLKRSWNENYIDKVVVEGVKVVDTVMEMLSEV